MMKQVAKKSTTVVPQKTVVSQRVNGCVKLPNTETLKDADDSHKNGHHDLHSQLNSVVSHSASGTRDNAGSKAPVSSTSAAQIANKSTEATTSQLSSAASKISATNDCEITIVEDDSNERQSFTERGESRLKRHTSGVTEEACQVKKSRVDNGASVPHITVVKRSVSRKELDECISACADRYLKTAHSSDIVLLMKKIKDLEESRDKWKKKASELQQKLTELTARCNSNSRIAPRSNPASLSQPGVSAVTPVKTQPLLLCRAPSVPSSPISVSQHASPSRLPSASANLAAVQRVTRPLLIQQQVAPSVASSSLVAAVPQVDNSKAVIDLTDDDDSAAVAPVTRSPATFIGRTLVVNAAGYQVPSASTAVVKPYTTRPSFIQVVEMRPPAPLQLPSAQLVRVPTQVTRHPAPLPLGPVHQRGPLNAKLVPPKPTLKLSRVSQGIVLSWNMSTTDEHEAAVQYQLFAYQQNHELPSSSLWKRVGTVEALPLPMACTLTQFQVGNIYHFAVRAVDAHGRLGPYSEPGSIHLEANSLS